MTTSRNPFVLGKPIKDPADFYGREHELRELFESVVNMQPVAMVGEHRCGNTSILYQMLDPTVQQQYLPAGSTDDLLFVFVNAQLAAEGPEAFHRRVARALKRADPDAGVDFDDVIDNFWIEDYLEDLADRDKRLVLLLDEFEVLASFPASFWEWFRGLITEYDMSIVAATRVELGEFRDEWGSGSPFFNMFRSIYIGAFSPGDVDALLTDAAAESGVDFTPVRTAIDELAGRFPYYVQVAGALFYEALRRGFEHGSDEQVTAVAREFRSRTEPHFEDIWAKLPDSERDALVWLAVGAVPDARESLTFAQALPSLERRGYVVDDRIFSAVFADYVRRQTMRIELHVDSGEVRIEKRSVELPPKEFALLRFMLENEGEIVSKEDIASAVWPEYSLDALGVTDAMIQKTISRLRKEVDASETGFQHIESVRGQGYRFQNASVFEVYQHRENGKD
ncbi:MAG: winged helix-turn-helix domain-containing protein [Anaerolineae bacterium]|jgi:DNA-binding winged helix-turn-helix (wHTH) protein